MPDANPSPRFNSDVVVSGTAIFISLCTFAVLLYEARIMRAQQRAAVWPYVEIGMGFSDNAFAVRSSNQGIGPARIRSMEVHVDGEPVETWHDMLDTLGVDVTDYSEDRTNGRVLPEQSSLASLQVRSESTVLPVHKAYLDNERLTFVLCYTKSGGFIAHCHCERSEAISRNGVSPRDCRVVRLRLSPRKDTI